MTVDPLWAGFWKRNFGAVPGFSPTQVQRPSFQFCLPLTWEEAFSPSRRAGSFWVPPLLLLALFKEILHTQTNPSFWEEKVDFSFRLCVFFFVY